MRLIDADAIKLPKGFFEEVDNVPKFYEWLNEQPTIEERKTGKWVGNGFEPLRCSVCGKVSNGLLDIPWANRFFRYCPNCGARMVEQ